MTQGIDLKSLKKCSYCPIWYDCNGEVNNPGLDPARASHGVCTSCLAIELEKLHSSQDSIRLMEGLAA